MVTYFAVSMLTIIVTMAVLAVREESKHKATMRRYAADARRHRINHQLFRLKMLRHDLEDKRFCREHNITAYDEATI